MVTLKPLAKARILVVGAGDLVNEILQNLVSHGVHELTVMDASTAADENICNFVKKDPEEYIKADCDYFKTFDIVLSSNQPRPFELALSKLRWQETDSDSELDLPLIVARSSSNTCKMRCQYRELLVNGNESSNFISLPMELLPWTEEKRALVASTINDEFKPDQNPIFQAYLTAALAVVNFQQSKGSWPGSQDKKQTQAMVNIQGSSLQPQIQDFVNHFCDGGLAAAHESIAIIGRLVVLDAIKLLTGNGKPINNANLEEVIQIVANR